MRGNNCKGYPRVPSIYLTSEDPGCFADTGAWPLEQRRDERYTLNIGSDCTFELSTILHELGHTLGLCHEQERADRN